MKRFSYKQQLYDEEEFSVKISNKKHFISQQETWH